MFLFYLAKEEIKKEKYEQIIDVKKNIHEKDKLFELYSSQLQFPEYFGKNWDSFYDCMCNLEHLNKKSFLIIHENVPFRESATDRTAYIDVLVDLESILSEEQNQIYQIDIAFPLKNKSKLEKILAITENGSFEPETLSYLDAFKSMYYFLKKYYDQTASDDVGSLLGDLQFSDDNITMDPTAWHDWLDCVGEVKKKEE